MIPSLIHALISGGNLAAEDLEQAVHAIMRGEADDVPVAGLLVALASRPVEPPLLAAAARALREHRVPVRSEAGPLVDTCGTGGDGAGTFNVSTAAAFVVAACGGAVAKHGNRGVSSPVGSADVLEALDCAVDLPPEATGRLLDEHRFAFLFAPRHHPAMRHVAPVRKALGVRTLFNLLGPLANPALSRFQVLGVYDPALTEPMARTLEILDSTGALVVHCDGLDEIGLHAPTRGHRLRDGRIEPFVLDPAEDLGLARAPVEALGGGIAPVNAARVRGALDGSDKPAADVVALNAAAALHVAGLAADLRDALAQAREAQSSGAAAAKLRDYAAASRAAAQEGA